MNIWNERRRKHGKARPKLGTVITRNRFIEILREHGACRNAANKMAEGLPFDTQHLVGVRFEGDQIHMEWKPRKFPVVRFPVTELPL